MLVKAGRTTWDDLEKRGASLPTLRSTRPSVFRKALEDLGIELGKPVKDLVSKTQNLANDERGAIHPIMPTPIPEPPPVAVPTPAPPTPVPPTLPPLLEDPGNAAVMRGVSNAIDEAEFTPPCEPGTKMEIEVPADQPPVPPWER